VEKAPDAFRTISEVAAELNVPQHVLRFWESRFSEIKPMKRGGGRRYYRPDDVDLLRGIRHLLYGEGYTIRGVQRILKEQGLRYVQTIWQPGAAGAAAPESEDGDFAGEETDPPEQPGRERGRGLFGLLPSLIGNASDAPPVKARAPQKQQEEDEDQEEESDEDVDAEADEEEADEEEDEEGEDESDDDAEIAEDKDSDYDESDESDSEDEDSDEGDEEDEEEDDEDEDENENENEESDEDEDDGDEDDDEDEDQKPPKSKQALRPLTLRQPAQPIGGSLRAAISIDDMRKLESALQELSECRKLLEALD
jgi:DNA-binding transcriptional MerR regulator